VCVCTPVSRYQKGKTNLDLLEQEIVSGSGISWVICKSAPRPRQITTPAFHHSVFAGQMPFLPPNQQCQITESKPMMGTYGSLSRFSAQWSYCSVMLACYDCNYTTSMEVNETWRQMPTLTRHPKLVLTERADKPRFENSFEKDDVSCMRGRSSAITHSVRTLDRFTPRLYSDDINGPSSLEHRSITWYEQNVSRTATHGTQMTQCTHKVGKCPRLAAA